MYYESWFRHHYLSVLTLRPSPAGLCCYDNRQDDPDQFRASRKPDKVARPNYTTKSESSKDHKYFAPEADNPAGNISVPFSAQTSPRPLRDSGAVPILGPLCGNHSLGPKVYINMPSGAWNSITLLTTYRAHCRSRKATAQPIKYLK